MKALITGATSGIGKCIAENLHNHGWKLILTGRNEKVLKKMQRDLGNNTEIIKAELSDRNEVFKVYEFCKDKNIDLLVNNAGYGIFGKFDETDLDDELSMIDVNITALHILTKLFLRDFKKRDRGYILNVASVAGFMTGPLLSSYYASKNYVIRLSSAIYEELKHEHSNVKITVLCPGPVNTNFNNRAGVSFSMKPASPEYVADYALKTLFRGKFFAIPLFTTKVCAIGQRFVPERLLSIITYHIQKAKKNNNI